MCPKLLDNTHDKIVKCIYDAILYFGMPTQVTKLSNMRLVTFDFRRKPRLRRTCPGHR